MNVLYLHTHDTGRVVSPYGYGVSTPRIQEFCEDALLFQHAYCVSPTCSPSRSALLTGIYPHQNGMLGLAQRGFELDGSRHLARLLSRAGFTSVLCGVQHEVGYYTSHELAPAALGYNLDLTADASPYAEKDLVIWDHANAKRLADWLVSSAGEKPFFASFGQHATHRAWPDADPGAADYARPPVNIPNTELTRADFAGFKKSVALADANIGLVLDALRESGRANETIVLLTTDHGLAYPFEKCTLLDAGTGVLMAMRVPDSAARSRSFDGLVSHLDVLPTLLDLLCIEKPDYLEGTSHAKVFAGEKDPGDAEVFSEINFHTSYEPARAVRTERYCYVRYFDDAWPRQNLSNVDGSTVKNLYLERGLAERPKELEQLYDLTYDAFETHNVEADPRYAEVLEDMRTRLARFMEKTNDPLLRGAIEVDPRWKVNRRSCVAAGSKDPADYESLGMDFMVRERGMA